jgi:hypothetical protein
MGMNSMDDAWHHPGAAYSSIQPIDASDFWLAAVTIIIVVVVSLLGKRDGAEQGYARMKNRSILFMPLTTGVTIAILTFAAYKGQFAIGAAVCCALVLASFAAATPNEVDVCRVDLALKGVPLPPICALCGSGPCEKPIAPPPARPAFKPKQDRAGDLSPPPFCGLVRGGSAG